MIHPTSEFIKDIKKHRTIHYEHVALFAITILVQIVVFTYILNEKLSDDFPLARAFKIGSLSLFNICLGSTCSFTIGFQLFRYSTKSTKFLYHTCIFRTVRFIFSQKRLVNSS